jgi:hypothetical protein
MVMMAAHINFQELWRFHNMNNLGDTLHATLVAFPESGPAPLTVQFTPVIEQGDVNFDLGIDWDFGDGTVERTTVLETVHVFSKPGIYSVTCVVTDYLNRQVTLSGATLGVVVTVTDQSSITAGFGTIGMIVLAGAAAAMFFGKKKYSAKG